MKVEAVDEKQSIDDKKNMPPKHRLFNNNKSQMATFIDRSKASGFLRIN